MNEQLAQTYTANGILVCQRRITTEAEYTAYLREMALTHGDGAYTVCAELED